MAKLIKILGLKRLELIRNEKPDLHAALMDYIETYKFISKETCRELLVEYNFTFTVEQDAALHKKMRANGAEFNDDDSFFGNSNNGRRDDGMN